MASLTKTYTRDLSTAIAGKLWEAVKDADERNKLEKSKASEEVKQEAVKLKKEDSESIPVKDKDLRETIVSIFGPLEGKFLQTEGRIDNLSGKVTAVAGGIADTQKLIINQNQILEDKFDQMFSIIGDRSAIAKQKEAEGKYKQLSLDLSKGLDLSGTFGTSKTSGGGSFGIAGKLLSTLLGNRWTAQLAAQISRSLIPKGLRSRGRLLRKSLLPIRKLTRGLTRPGSFVARRLIQPFAFHSAKQGGKIGSKVVGEAFGSILLRRGIRSIWRDIFLGNKSAEEIAKNIIRIQEAKKGKAVVRTSGKVIKKKLSKTAVKSGAKATVRKSTPKVLKRTIQDGVFLRALSNPRVQAEIVQKIGVEGAEKIGIKLAAGAGKGAFPLIGTGYAVIEGLVRLAMGDSAGMLLSFGSGIPAAGWGFAIIDILRDIDKDAYVAHIKPNLPVPSDSNIAAFFQQALGISPDQYERGNVNLKPSKLGGNSSTIDAISQLLGVSRAYGEATGFEGEIQQEISNMGLGSFPIPRTNYSFDVGSVRSLTAVGGDKGQREIKELKMSRKREELDRAKNDKANDDANDNNEQNNNQDLKEEEKKDRWWIDPRGWGMFGGGGIGGNDNVVAQTPVMGGSPTTIEFWGQQGVDKSGEPGVDFSYKDYKSNYNLFPGYVLETGLLYGDRYGNVVVVRSTDPSNGKEFDSLYSHFPDGGIAVKPGQVVSAGDYLGKVGFVSVDVPGVPQMQPNNAGNMSGWHTSVDFFEPGSAARYHNADKIINLVTGADGQTPNGLLEKLKPPVTSDDQSSLNNIESNSNLASTMTSMVEKGSSERLMTKRKSSKRLPIVIINNQVINTSQTQVAMGNSKESSNFFEAYNLARYTV